MKCKHIKVNGSKCNAKAMTGSDSCFRHSCDTKQQAIEASIIGGLNRRNYQKYGDKLQLNNLDDIKSLIANCINKIWTGEMSSQNPAGSIGYLARVLLEIQKVDSGVIGTQQGEDQKKLHVLLDDERVKYGI